MDDYQVNSNNNTILKPDVLQVLFNKHREHLSKNWPWNNNVRSTVDPWRSVTIPPYWKWTTMPTTVRYPTVWNWNAEPTRKVEWSSTSKETDSSGTIIAFFVVLAVGIFILIYALRCIKDCQEWKSDVLSRRNASFSSPAPPTRTRAAPTAAFNSNAENEVVIEIPVDQRPQWTPLPNALTTFHLVTLVPANPQVTLHPEGPPPSYEKATEIFNEPPKYEDCVR